MTTVYEDYNFTLPPSEDEQEGFAVLEPGEYPFTVAKIEFGMYEPGENSKAPACKSVKVTLMIEHNGTKTFVGKDFLLYSDLAWLIRQFFISIGMGGHGKEVQVNWDRAKGRRGIVKIKKIPGRNEGTWFNNVDKFIDPPNKQTVPPPQRPAPTPTPIEDDKPPQEEEIPFDF